MTDRLADADRIWTNARCATLSAPGFDSREDFAVASRNGRIIWTGPCAAIASMPAGTEIIDVKQRWITPGLIDSHTHLLYGGNRSTEFEQRLQGLSYEEIARRGGGIRSTVAATRALSEQQLVEASLPRLQALCDEGVTTVEVKSGYGLSINDELKMLRAARQLSERIPVTVRTTLLAAHAVPPEFDGRADHWVDLICQELIPTVAAENLAEAVDVFCEGIGFTPAQCERIFIAARDQGLGIKAHVEQLSYLGGAALAASYGAWSVDHIEYLPDTDAEALADHDTVACLLPGAFYFLNESRRPPVQRLREAGVPMAVASDLNPGSSPLASLRLMMNMSAVLFGLTPTEALQGVTCHAARALGLGASKGQLSPGYDADLLIWDIDHPAQLSYEFGTPRLLQRVVNGNDTLPGNL